MPPLSKPNFYFSKHFSNFPNYFGGIYSQCYVYIFVLKCLDMLYLLCIDSFFSFLFARYLLFIFIINLHRLFVF